MRVPFDAYVSDSRRRCGWRPPYFDRVLADFARCSDHCLDSVSFLLGFFDCADFFGGATIGCTPAATIVPLSCGLRAEFLRCHLLGLPRYMAPGLDLSKIPRCFCAWMGMSGTLIMRPMNVAHGFSATGCS